MQIKHVGHCSINTVAKTLALKNVLHVPKISKHLISVHKLTRDNNVIFEFHPDHYVVKDRESKRTILEGKCESGLYPIKPSDVESSKQAFVKQAFVSSTISKEQCHARFGHPSSHIVQSILHLNNLPCARESRLSVCNACQLAKSHQLPYSRSTHVSTFHLELVFSDVWGPAPQSVGGYKYYISFIDDFSKFSWIYMMHDRTEAPRIFLQFKVHVERLLDTRIKCVQSDWGGEYQKIHNQFFLLSWHCT